MQSNTIMKLTQVLNLFSSFSLSTPSWGSHKAAQITSLSPDPREELKLARAFKNGREAPTSSRDKSFKQFSFKKEV